MVSSEEVRGLRQLAELAGVVPALKKRLAGKCRACGKHKAEIEISILEGWLAWPMCLRCAAVAHRLGDLAQRLMPP